MRGNKTTHEKREQAYSFENYLSDSPDIIALCLSCPYKECKPTRCTRLASAKQAKKTAPNNCQKMEMKKS